MLWEKEGGYEIVLKIICIYCANTIDGNLSRKSTDVLTNLSVVTNSIKISMDRQKTFVDIIFSPREMLNWLCTVHVTLWLLGRHLIWRIQVLDTFEQWTYYHINWIDAWQGKHNWTWLAQYTAISQTFDQILLLCVVHPEIHAINR